MKFFKRLLALVAVLLSVVIAIGAIALLLFRATPQWYRFPIVTAEEREAAAQRATNKLAMIHNEAARLRAQRQAARAATHPTTRPVLAEPDSITVSFTDAELNAFFDKWAVWNDWKAVYEQHVTDPAVILTDGRIILAGRVAEMNTVASLHFEPRLDEQGRLHIRLVRVLGGNLPLPEAVVNGHRKRLLQLMQAQMPYWRDTAEIDRNGTPNTSAVCATMGTLLVHILNHEAGEPVLFLPLVDQGAVAVKLTHLRIHDHTITLTVEPLRFEERSELLRRLRNGTSLARLRAIDPPG